MPKLTVDMDNVQDVANSMELLKTVLHLHQQMQQPAPPMQPTAPAPTQAPVAPPAPAPTAPPPAAPPAAAPAPGAPQAAQPQAGTVDTTMLRQQLSDLTRQLGPRMSEVGALIQARGKSKVSELTPEELQGVLTQVQQMVAANG